MAKQRKSKIPTTSGKLEAPYVFWAPTESQPSQVSGLFQDDPTFEEFCAILRQQRAAVATSVGWGLPASPR
jgi:hypothetical protein